MPRCARVTRVNHGIAKLANYYTADDRRVPDAPARALIKAIREEPAAVRRALARPAA
jgi:hypothetical protein